MESRDRFDLAFCKSEAVYQESDPCLQGALTSILRFGDSTPLIEHAMNPLGIRDVAGHGSDRSDLSPASR